MTFEYLHSGLRISILHGDRLWTRLYIGYSKREAARLFRQWVRGF